MWLPARPVSAAQPPLTDRNVSTARPDPIGSDRVAQSVCEAAYHGLLAVMREVKDGVRIFVIQVIEEDAAAASAFIVSVLDHKVVITPLLELGPVLWVVLITHRLSSSTQWHTVGCTPQQPATPGTPGSITSVCAIDAPCNLALTSMTATHRAAMMFTVFKVYPALLNTKPYSCAWVHVKSCGLRCHSTPSATDGEYALESAPPPTRPPLPFDGSAHWLWLEIFTLMPGQACNRWWQQHCAPKHAVFGPVDTAMQPQGWMQGVGGTGQGMTGRCKGWQGVTGREQSTL